MHVDNLRAFVSVYDQGSFSLAAEHLFVTQPAISKRVALLEEQLQTRLFDRMGRKINPTPTGNALYPRALAILSEMEDTQRAISNLSGNVSGQLGIATNHHIGMWRL
ncbi:MAG TPA: LysR family transcriptional regulator, partial [Gammaproteobacteria bacterium]|nr:LysR family transcriptional regulator [Gammaproteobacteria bacterium]